MNTIISKVNSQSLATITAAVEKLQARARKLNRPENSPTLEILAQAVEEYRNPQTLIKTPVTMYTIKVTAEPIRINGRILTAIIEHTPGEENFIWNTTLIETPTRYRTAPAYCEHCKTTRNRKRTYLLTKANDQTDIIQVGSTCLKDYTDNTDPAELAAYLDGWKALREAAERDPDAELYEGHRTSNLINLTGYMAAVISTIREHGYTSRTQARQTYTTATADLALERYHTAQQTQEDRDAADIGLEETLFHLEKAEEARGLSDFEHNARTLINDNGNPAAAIESHHAGLAAYLPQLLINLKEEARQRAIDGQSQYTGQPGDRETFRLTYENFYSYESQYGRTYIHKFSQGKDILIWKTGNALQDYRPGDTITLTATIKGHEEYKGTKQTHITRAKVKE